VTLPDGRELPANRVGFDHATDVAVIKLKLKFLAALPIGDSDTLEVGGFGLALATPFKSVGRRRQDHQRPAPGGM
jgi:S1-C subfamily serine protease